MDKNLKEKTLSGMIWKAAEQFGSQGISFVLSIILARLLLPEEYGTVAIVTVIISLCDVFVNSGLGTALIQKKDSDDIDFSTVFIFSFLFAAAIYALLFFAAPMIAVFYGNSILTSLIRVMALRIVIASITTVQRAYITKHMLFRKFFFSTLGGTLVSAIVGIALAYCGLGVWALVGQYLVCAFIEMIVLFVIVPWHPHLAFSLKRWVTLFSYSWKLLISSLVDTIYNNLRNLLIGKIYTAEDLAFYNKGKQFPDLISTNILSTIDNVLFSAIAIKQDDTTAVKSMVSRFIRVGSYLTMPMMLGMALVAEPLIQVLLTEKWLFCVPYVQIYCFVGFLQPIQTANQQAIKALGRSDITLKLEIIKKAFGVILLLCVMKRGVFAIAASNVVYSIVVLLLNTYPNMKLLSYSIIEQLKDIFENIFVVGIMGIAVYCVSLLAFSPIVTLLLQMGIGIAVYVLASHLMKNSSYLYILSTIRERRKA